MTISLVSSPALTIATLPGRLAAETYPVRCQRRIRWSDIQEERVSRVGMAHFFEDLRLITIGHLDAARGTRSETGSSFLRAVTIEHLAAASPDSPYLELAAGIASIGKSSFTYALAAFQQGRCVAVGSSVDVRVVDGRAAAWDEASLATLRQFLMPGASEPGTTAAARPPTTYPWSVVLETRFADTDCNGHLNNVSMSRYHDNAAMAFIREALGHTGRNARGQGLSVVRQEMSLDHQTHYPAAITMGAAVQDIQPHSFTLATASIQGDRRTSTSTAVVMWLDNEGRVQGLPDALVKKLLALRGESA